MIKERKKMAEVILNLEDSKVRGADDLVVRKLPSADRGGDWEICGICDGFEPEKFKQIKTLLDFGKKDEAWEVCCKYILSSTHVVTGWLGEREGWYGVELMLRDHMFNAGFKSSSRVFQRALNRVGASLITDAQVGPKTRRAYALVTCEEKVLIEAIKRCRDNYYRECKQFNTFGKGWLNRNEKCFSAALRLAEKK